MKLPLLEFRIHVDGSAEFVEAQLDWDVFTTQLECICHLQARKGEIMSYKERRDNEKQPGQMPQSWVQRMV
jgi:hypothetical protein